MVFTSKEIVCPKGTVGESPIVIELEAIRVSEARQDEVAMVTKIKAPELLAEFNRSMRELNKIIVQLRSEKNKAEKAIKRRKGELMLGDVAKVLKDKSISSTADTREAVIDLDPVYQKLEDTMDEIEAVIEFLQGKFKSFENAFSSVKKVLGEYTPNMPNSDLGGDTRSPTRSGFGKARY